MASRQKTDYVRALTYYPHERMNILRSLTIPERAAIFEQLSPYVQQSILQQLKLLEIVNMLDHMDLHQARRVLARIPSVGLRSKIVKRLRVDIKDKLDYFLRFHPKATLSLINFNYLFLSVDLTLKQAAIVISDHYEETSHYPEVLVHDRGELVGTVSLASIVRERNTNTLKKFVQPVQTITYQAEVSEIVQLLVSTNSKKVVVLDQDTSVLGIIYADSAKTLFGKMPSESLYDFAGVDDSEQPFDSAGRKVSNRYRWLIVNLVTCFMAGSVVLFFQDTLNALTILSVYMPIVSGMAGNAATQSFAVMVRGLTLGSISLENSAPAIWKELLAGIANGVIIGGLVALVSTFWNGSVMLGVVVGVALILTHMVAAIAGSIIPLFMKHIGRDPAATASIFISTATDVFGFLFLLGLATVFLL